VISTTIAALALIAGGEATGWARSQVLLKTGTTTVGSADGIGVGEGDALGDAVCGGGEATRAGLELRGWIAAGRAVAATTRIDLVDGVVSRCMPRKAMITRAPRSGRASGLRRRGGASRRREERAPRVPRLYPDVG
jgi:hypothetical protein